MTLAVSTYSRVLLSTFPLPLKLILLQFAWILPYLFLTNYLERSLLPFRFLCYTDSDLLNVQTPVRRPLEACISHFFPDRSPDPNCTLNQPLDAVLEPRLPLKFEKVIVIRSAPGSVVYRNFIRNTWKQSFEDTAVPVVFVAGLSGDRRVNEELLAEADRFEDILQLKFVDSYVNLTLKMMATYGYFLRRPEVGQIIVINDDTIVNKTALIGDANDLREREQDSYMAGKVSRGYPRLIFPWLTWHVPGAMYSHMCYPPFVQGSSFILSRTAALQMVNHVCDFPFVHLDDVMAGIMANCLGLQLAHREGFDRHILDRFTVYHYQYSRHSAADLTAMWHRIRPEL